MLIYINILLIFMSDMYFLYMSNKECFTFIIHHFVRFISKKTSIFKERMLKKAVRHTEEPVNIRTFNLYVILISESFLHGYFYEAK